MTADATLTTVQLAQRWQVSASHLNHQRSAGQGCRYLKLSGGAVRYRLADVEAYEAASIIEVAA